MIESFLTPEENLTTPTEDVVCQEGKGIRFFKTKREKSPLGGKKRYFAGSIPLGGREDLELEKYPIKRKGDCFRLKNGETFHGSRGGYVCVVTLRKKQNFRGSDPKGKRGDLVVQKKKTQSRHPVESRNGEAESKRLRKGG